jgi:hypothetical protein
MVGDGSRGSRSFFCLGSNVKARFSEPICSGFLKGVGMPVALQDNIEDCCERCYLKVTLP